MGRQTPPTIAREIEDDARFWLVERLHERFGGPPVDMMIELIRASERWTLPADELLPALVRVSIEMAEHYASGAVDREAVDAAIGYLRAVRVKQGANSNGMVSEPIDDEPTGRKIGQAHGETGEPEDAESGQSRPAGSAASSEGKDDDQDDDDPAEEA